MRAPDFQARQSLSQGADDLCRARHDAFADRDGHVQCQPAVLHALRTQPQSVQKRADVRRFAPPLPLTSDLDLWLGQQSRYGRIHGSRRGIRGTGADDLIFRAIKAMEKLARAGLRYLPAGDDAYAGWQGRIQATGDLFGSLRRCQLQSRRLLGARDPGAERGCEGQPLARVVAGAERDREPGAPNSALESAEYVEVAEPADGLALLKREEILRHRKHSAPPGGQTVSC